MNRNPSNHIVTIIRQVIAAIAALFLLSLFLSVRGAAAEDANTFDMDNWNGESVILEDPKYFIGVEDDHIPVISSVGKTNVKIRGGNAVVKKGCDGYGDLHPRMGYPESANDTPELIDYLRVLRDEGFFNAEEPYVLSMEVTLRPGEDEDIVLANTKRVLNRAWAMLED